MIVHRNTTVASGFIYVWIYTIYVSFKVKLPSIIIVCLTLHGRIIDRSNAHRISPNRKSTVIYSGIAVAYAICLIVLPWLYASQKPRQGRVFFCWQFSEPTSHLAWTKSAFHPSARAPWECANVMFCRFSPNELFSQDWLGQNWQAKHIRLIKIILELICQTRAGREYTTFHADRP